MTPKEAPKLSSLNNTLETVNRERVKIFRRGLALIGSDTDVPDHHLLSYLSNFSPDLTDIHLLGKPEELMPSFLNRETNRRALYLSEDEETGKAMEKLLIQLGLSEANLIASMRSMLLFIVQRGGFQPNEYVAVAANTISPAIRERAVFLAGKYEFDLPESWLTAMPRELIRDMLLKGVQDKTNYAEAEDEDIRKYEARGESQVELAEDIRYINQVHEREMTYAFNDFFRRHSDPTIYTCQLLDIAAFRDMMTGRGRQVAKYLRQAGLN